MIYTSQIWGQNKCKIKKISELQDKAIRTINFKQKNYLVAELYKNSRILIGFELAKENRFAKIFNHCEGKKGCQKQQIYWIFKSFYEKCKDFQLSFAN